MRKSLFFLIAAAATSPLAGWAVEPAEPQVRIELRPQVAARGDRVLLGDIAILHTRDLTTIQRLAALPLGHTPRAGSEAVVRREVIARWIRSQLGIQREDVEWAGPQESTVRGVAQDYAGARVESTAAAELRTWLAKHANRYTVDIVGLAGELQLPAGAVQLVARPLAAGAEPRSRMTVWVDILVDGRFARAIPVSFAVEAFRDAWVTPVSTPANVALTQAALERREVRVVDRAVQSGVDPFAVGASPQVWRTTRALKEGEAVSTRNSAPTPTIARGAWVALHMKSGPVELVARAQALQDGEVGQVVQVRSSNGSAPVAARVVAAGRVEALL